MKNLIMMVNIIKRWISCGSFFVASSGRDFFLLWLRNSFLVWWNGLGIFLSLMLIGYITQHVPLAQLIYVLVAVLYARPSREIKGYSYFKNRLNLLTLGLLSVYGIIVTLFPLIWQYGSGVWIVFLFFYFNSVGEHPLKDMALAIRNMGIFCIRNLPIVLLWYGLLYVSLSIPFFSHGLLLGLVVLCGMFVVKSLCEENNMYIF